MLHLGLEPEDILDFSVNTNPYGSSPAVYDAVTRTVIERYPDRDCLRLRAAISNYELGESRTALSSLLCGNGSSELIWAIARAYLAPDRRAIIIGPTFGEYAAASRAVGANIKETRLSASAGFQLDVPAFCATLRSEWSSLVWLCNPNNPTGSFLNSKQVFLIAEACAHAGALLVIDESYWHFVFPSTTSTAVDLLTSKYGGNVLVVRSLTKDFALAGLRLGYVVGAEAHIETIGALLPSWNVNSVAQEAGCAALADREHLHGSLQRLAAERQAFFVALRQVGLRVIPSRTHFCLVEVGNAQRVRRELLQRRLLVRDCSSFGLPSFIRVATRPAFEWSILVEALQEVV